MLASDPDCLEKISLFLIVQPSREDVEDYQELKKELDEMVGRINGEYGTFNWQPVRYFYRHISRDESIALYRGADIALITPLGKVMKRKDKE